MHPTCYRVLSCTLQAACRRTTPATQVTWPSAGPLQLGPPSFSVSGVVGRACVWGCWVGAGRACVWGCWVGAGRACVGGCWVGAGWLAVECGACWDAATWPGRMCITAQHSPARPGPSRRPACACLPEPGLLLPLQPPPWSRSTSRTSTGSA